MGTIKKTIREIPFTYVQEIDAMFGRQMNMDVEHIPAKFASFFARTRKDAVEQLTMEGVYASYKISEITNEKIRLNNGEVLQNEMLARAFAHSSELVLYVIGASGYEALDEAEENMVAKLFLDSWGTAIVSYGSLSLKRLIRSELEPKGLHSTFSFSPGQHNIPMELQQVIFQLLQPQDINVTLNEHYLMHPKKSVSGLFGIGPVKDEEGLRPCDFCRLRETCSSAYAEDEMEA